MTITLNGITAALVTPLDQHGRLDEPALARLIQRAVDGGVIAVSPTGSTGEGARLSRDQRLEATHLVCRCAPAGMPVVSGVPLASVAEGLMDLEQLAEHGAAAALVAPPHYYPLGDDEILRLYTFLADRSPLPILLYNIPVFTKVRFSPPVVAELAAHPRIVGIKDSSRDIEYFQQVLAAIDEREFSVLTGSDSFLVACLVAGATGAIAASANLVPDLSVGIHRAFTNGDLDSAVRLQKQLSRVIHICRAGTLPAGWKAALAHVGVCEPYLAAPASTLDDARRRVLGDELTAAGVR